MLGSSKPQERIPHVELFWACRLRLGVGGATPSANVLANYSYSPLQWTRSRDTK